jgi:DNA-binding response OmpR family regulator
MGLFRHDPDIVIVEDNEALAEVYKTRLEIIGYKCVIAVDGEQALQLIQTLKPKLVLLDLMIPKTSGYDVLTQMRASDWGKDIKVHIISNLNEADAPAGLRAQGIEGYSVKANLVDDDLDNLVARILQTPEVSNNGS